MSLPIDTKLWVYLNLTSIPCDWANARVQVLYPLMKMIPTLCIRNCGKKLTLLATLLKLYGTQRGYYGRLKIFLNGLLFLHCGRVGSVMVGISLNARTVKEPEGGPMRQTGRTTKMLTKALISDAKDIVILAPRMQILSHLKRMFIKLAPKPDKVVDDCIIIGNRRFFFIVPHSRTPMRFKGIKDLYVDADHTLFELGFYTPEIREAYEELTEQVRRQYAIQRSGNETDPESD